MRCLPAINGIVLLRGLTFSDVAGGQAWPGSGPGAAWEAGRQRPGGAQAHHWCILTHFPRIYIKLYLNEVRRHGPGLKMCFWVVSLFLKSWVGIGLGPFFPLCDQAIRRLVNQDWQQL